MLSSEIFLSSVRWRWDCFFPLESDLEDSDAVEGEFFCLRRVCIDQRWWGPRCAGKGYGDGSHN
ncbi:hypothetical protein RHMOL_Rhmol09G0100600 [Rhododendron molle]|uniref:Uncharacterized protein n=1 Tax=Rhododendron molle TaxID=49168 RepID=A0ACC0MDM3_RHOML|nr:hypothetical protein RHMOL_Rhmol09G0100600 [Rhododendron molle]